MKVFHRCGSRGGWRSPMLCNGGRACVSSPLLSQRTDQQLWNTLQCNMHPFVFYKFDKASHRYDYPSSVTLGIPCYEILAGRGVQELPSKSDRRGNLLAGQGLLRLGQASMTEESYALQLQSVHLLLEGPPQVLRGG